MMTSVDRNVTRFGCPWMESTYLVIYVIVLNFMYDFFHV